MRRFLVLLALLFCAVPSFAQTTSVSGTITDAGGQAWASGTIQFVFRPSNSNPTGQYFQGGVPFDKNTTVPSAPLPLDGTGSFSALAVPDNATITPSGSTFNVTVCPAATTPCLTKSLTITGATLNISAQIVPPAINLNLTVPFLGARAYTDAEVSGAAPGTLYFNNTDNRIHVCLLAGFPPCTWFPLNSGSVNSVTVGSLPPLFNTTNIGTATDPNFQFSRINEPQDLVYATPCGIGGTPTFRSLCSSDFSSAGIVTSVEGTPNQIDVCPTGTPTCSIAPRSGDVTIQFPNLVVFPAQMNVTGNFQALSEILGSRNVQAGAGGFYFDFLNSTRISDGGNNGILQLTDNATTSFVRLTLGPSLGGAAANFPALQPNGPNLDIERADGAVRVGVRAANVTDDALTVGNCVQAGTAGILGNAAGPCASGFTQAQTIKKTGNCTIASGGASYDTCTDTLTWPVAFADTNYVISCTGVQPAVNGGNPANNQAPTLTISSYTASQVIMITQNQRTATAHYTEIHCIGIHP
jgi:hypothetical protein